MNKLMIVAAAAAISASASAATLVAQVYDVNLTVKTTACKEIKYTKTIAALEGEDYKDVKTDTVSTRKQASTKIAGVIWGCECETIANPAWRLYARKTGASLGGYLFWNVGAEHPFNIFTTTFKWAVLNRIDKGESAEGVWALANTDANNTVGLLGAGFGKVKGLNCTLTLTSMSGNFAGFILAGSEAGGCAFCGSTECDTWAVCPCTPVVYDTSLTAAYGTWKIKYNKSASQKLRKTGYITKSYNFKKAGDAAAILAKAENKAAKDGDFASEDDLWPFEGDGEEYGVEVEADDVGGWAYSTGTGDSVELGEAPEEYDGENVLVSAILSIAGVESEEDPS